MKTIASVAEMQAAALRARAEGTRIGFVPTMGYLHEGHLSLVRTARDLSDLLVVSVFVNPTQFGPAEDFSRYPRDPERDAGLCAAERVDILFCPSAGEMYAPDRSVTVDETRLAAGLCGRSRPGHFRGVVTVVAKLFNIVQPQVAVFGRKDAQQARIIEQLVRDLNFPVRIVVAPTVREPDGLAMSSRNAYLTPGERRQAACLYAALRLAEQLYSEGARETAVIRAGIREHIGKMHLAEIDYVETVSYHDLAPVDWIEGPTLVALAVRIGRTRLIDNTLLGGE